MAKPDSDMEGTICKNCERPINDHLPEELEVKAEAVESRFRSDSDISKI